MTTTSDPITVLREAVREGRYERDRVDSSRKAAEWQAKCDEAIAQVEALVEAASELNKALDEACEWPHCNQSLGKAIAPFTPGQDSEGGGHG